MEEIMKSIKTINGTMDMLNKWLKKHKYHYHYRRVLNILWSLEEMEENLHVYGEIYDPREDTLIANGEDYADTPDAMGDCDI